MSTEAPNVFALEQSEGSSLTADFSWTFVGNAIYAAGQFAILMLLTKLVRPELVGQYALGLALVYPVKSAVREEPSLCSSANTLGASVLIGLAPLAFCDCHGPHFHPSREFTCFKMPYFCAARVSCAITFSGRAFASAEVNSTAPSRLRCIPSGW